MWDAANLELLLKLKQGQVEVEQAPFVTDYSDCVFINKQVIEDYNTNIKTQAKDKVALLKEMKNTKKLIRKKKWYFLELFYFRDLLVCFFFLILHPGRIWAWTCNPRTSLRRPNSSNYCA